MGSDPKFYSICRLFYPLDKQEELSQELATQSLLTLQPLHLLVSSTIKKTIFFQVLFQIALATLDANRNKLLAVRDDGEAMTVLGNYLEHVTNRDATTLTNYQGGYSKNNGSPSSGVIVLGIGEGMV